MIGQTREQTKTGASMCDSALPDSFGHVLLPIWNDYTDAPNSHASPEGVVAFVSHSPSVGAASPPRLCRDLSKLSC